MGIDLEGGSNFTVLSEVDTRALAHADEVSVLSGQVDKEGNLHVLTIVVLDLREQLQNELGSILIINVNGKEFLV